MPENNSGPQTMNKKILIALFVVLIIALGFILYKDQKVANFISPESAQNINSVDSELADLRSANKDTVDKAGELKVSLVSSIDVNDNYNGELDASVEVIYYSDFAAPFVEKVFDNIQALQDKFQNDIVVAYRYYFSGEYENSIILAQAAECAAQDGKFWEMARRLSEVQQNAVVDESKILAIAADLDIAGDDFSACLADVAIKASIENEVAEAENFGVMGVPTIFVNKIILAGSYPLEDFIDSTDLSRQGLYSIIQEELDKVRNPVQE